MSAYTQSGQYHTIVESRVRLTECIQEIGYKFGFYGTKLNLNEMIFFIHLDVKSIRN